MTPAELRKELGELLLRAESVLAHAEREVGDGCSDFGVLCIHLRAAIPALRAANIRAGKMLVAQLTDADRAQADEAGRRA